MRKPPTRSTQVYLSAKEAAAELGIELPTLYAYVSRGLIRSEARSGHRSRLYRAEDVHALTRKKAPAESGERASDRALYWGLPVLDSAITLIADDALYYRGRDAARLAADSTLETVAALIWQSGERNPFAATAPAVPEGFERSRNAASGLRPIDRCQALLPILAAADRQAFNRTPDGIAHTGARIMRWMTALICGAPPGDRPAHLVLAEAWSVPEAHAALLRAAMVLCADHELNVSTFTVRCVASAGTSPYGAVTAGLAALAGPLHGGTTERAEALLDTLLPSDDPERAVAGLLRRGEDPAGFGHRLYPHGDPRARCLLGLMEQAFREDSVLQSALSIAEMIAEQSGQAPTCDFALALLARRLDLPAGAALSLFAVGRAAGWIGHFLEQVAGSRLIRPRARYTGVHP